MKKNKSHNIKIYQKGKLVGSGIITQKGKKV